MRSNTIIRNEGMRSLRETLGLVEAEKFISLIRQESFDYTEWRKELLAGKSYDEIFELAAHYEKANPPKKITPLE